MALRPFGLPRALAAFGLLACAAFSLLPLGCGGGLEAAAAKHSTGSVGPHLPNATIARLRECVEEYGSELRGAGFEFHANAQVAADGRVGDVKTDVPHADLDACTRAALRAMSVPPSVLAPWVSAQLAEANTQTKEARGITGNFVIVGVTIVLADLIIEAGGVTIIFAVSLELAKDVVETIQKRPTWKDDCNEQLIDCLETPLGNRWSRSYNETRCYMCADLCRSPKERRWPERVQFADGTWASCAY